jgi:murein DD-endopeptidase MepM/ murein hydrolase activator NlpD
MFATPVPGYLHPMGWQRPAGNLEFVVTRGCFEHVKSGVGCALDIGNARQGAPVYALAPGTVYERRVQSTPGVGFGALIMRVRHANGWTSGYAHLQSFSVGINAIVKKGQQIGVLGATGQGISGPHLHTDVKLNGVARDLWPLLDQNQLPNGTGGDVPSPLKVYQPAMIQLDGVPKIDGKVPVYDQPNNTGTPVYLLTPRAGELLSIGQVPGSPTPWYTWWDVPKGKWLYVNYTNVAVLRPLVDPATLPPAGDATTAYNQGVDAAAKKAAEAKK